MNLVLGLFSQVLFQQLFPNSQMNFKPHIVNAFPQLGFVVPVKTLQESQHFCNAVLNEAKNLSHCPSLFSCFGPQTLAVCRILWVLSQSGIYDPI